MLSKIFSTLNKIDLDNIILKIILLFPISTIIQGIGIFSPINKVLIAGLMGILALSILKDTLTNYDLKKFILAVSIMVSSILGIILCNNFRFNINNLFHYVIFGLFALYLINRAEEFKERITKDQTFIYIIVAIWTLIIAISFFFETSYVTAWGDSLYFKSFSEGVTHRFASSASFILVLVFVLIKNTKKFSFKKISFYSLAIAPTICVLLSGARVYLIVAFLTLVAIYYMECKSQKIFWFTAIPIGLLAIVAVMLTPMGDKIIATLNNEYATNTLAAITSGRSDFWVYDMAAFFAQDPFFQIFGHGVSFVFNVNREMIGNAIYAHNDYINILLTYGYFGLIHYLIAIVWTIKSFYKNCKPKFVGYMCVFGVYFITAFLNGFYVYPCTLLSLPILMYCIIPKENRA